MIPEECKLARKVPRTPLTAVVYIRIIERVMQSPVQPGKLKKANSLRININDTAPN
jgi:hypothetical protein